MHVANNQATKDAALERNRQFHERILSVARWPGRAGSTIIWTRHAVRPDHSDVGILGETVPPVAQGVIDDGAPSAALHPKVVVQPGDIILAKPLWQFPSNGARNDLACSRD